MERNKSKIRVAVELKNGDCHRIACSNIEYNAYGIELWNLDSTINISFRYEDISLMSIFIENEQSKDKLMFRAELELKLERE